MTRSLKILMVMDLPYDPPTENHSSLVKGADFKDEVNVANALSRLGHSVEYLAIYNNVTQLVERITNAPPDLVFVMCESFAGQRGGEDHIVGLLQMYDIPFTGATPQNLMLCRDKALTKKVLSYHNIVTPKFEEFQAGKRPHKRVNFFPAICKPVGLEASEGITENSLVHDQKSLERQVEFLHRKFQLDVIAEEFVSGEEFYVAIVGDQRLRTFPPQFLQYKKWPATKPKIFSYRAKWDQNYRKKWGIDSNTAKHMDAKLIDAVLSYAKQVYKCLGLVGYARLDLRLNGNHKPLLIEANPNPGISRHDDFALAALHGGVAYDELIAMIVRGALNRHTIHREKNAA